MRTKKRLFGMAAAAFVALAAAPALAQGSDADALRATKRVGEQADGYLGFVNGQDPGGDLKARVNQVNIQRRQLYTQRAEARQVTVAEMGAATACQLLSSSVDPGEFWRDENGQWRERGSGPVPLPSFCPR